MEPLLQIGTYIITPPQVYYEWTGESHDSSSTTSEECDPAEVAKKPFDLTYTLYFAGGCSLENAQYARNLLLAELALPNLKLLRRITADALLETFFIEGWALRHDNFRLQLSRRRTLQMELRLTVKQDAGLELRPVMEAEVFMGVARVALKDWELGVSPTPLEEPDDFAGVSRVEG